MICPYCFKPHGPENNIVCCGEIGHLVRLCDLCSKADRSCPIWHPGKDIDYCVEFNEK